MQQLKVIETRGFDDYALVDSGAGRKLERFGAVLVDRPEPQALWLPGLARAEWDKANATFSASDDEDEKGRWRLNGQIPESWPVRVGKATMLCRLASFRHLGLFPEQYPHWQWMLDRLSGATDTPRVLNLFAYTGAASLLAAAAGAEVTHVDASNPAIAWARENQAASRLTETKVRWLLDDAAKFAAREVRRGRTYDMVLVDPPKFGRGPDGEIWDLFEGLPALLRSCAALLAPERSALVLTVYAIRASALAFDQLARDMLAGRRGTFESGELAIREQSGRHAVPTSLFTRWTSDARA
jgi:23S rRNA (cytosine1962-C5)-methyltransferase